MMMASPSKVNSTSSSKRPALAPLDGNATVSSTQGNSFGERLKTAGVASVASSRQSVRADTRQALGTTRPLARRASSEWASITRVEFGDSITSVARMRRDGERIQDSRQDGRGQGDERAAPGSNLSSPETLTGWKHALDQVQGEEEKLAKKPHRELSSADDAVLDSSLSSSQRSASQSSHRRSVSPGALSIFDTSAGDITSTTALTEPEAEDQRPAIRILPRLSHARLTPGQAREAANILRLRLGLASYKLRTGQTDVPLAHLRVRPLAGVRFSQAQGRPMPPAQATGPTTQQRRPLPSSRRSSDEEETRKREARYLDWVQEGERKLVHDEEQTLPRMLRPRLAGSPRGERREQREEEERSSRSVSRGGAADGLLSLSTARH